MCISFISSFALDLFFNISRSFVARPLKTDTKFIVISPYFLNMSRVAPFRRVVTDLVHRNQDHALNTTIYILRELGPVGFLLKEEGVAKCFKVNIGNPHNCSCSTFLKENDLCKHICWVLLKKFRLPRDHECAFQLGLVDREIEILLQNLHIDETAQFPTRNSNVKQNVEGAIGDVLQKEIYPEDICPICQEELLKKKQPVTYCSNCVGQVLQYILFHNFDLYTCGNSVHIKCMRIWVEHQTKIENAATIKCPLCREEFAPLSLLQEEFRNSTKFTTVAERERLDRHLGIPCNKCGICPIQGKCYRCLSCPDFHLCQKCFPCLSHPQHEFTFREKRNQCWKPLQQVSSVPLPLAVVDDLMNRDIVACDYDLLVQLDRNKSTTVPGHVVQTLPLIMVKERSKLLVPGQQCRVCLKAFRLRQEVRCLPCHHKFHKECIDHWLLHQSNSCPIDGQVIYNPLTWNEGPKRSKKKDSTTSLENSKPLAQIDQPQLLIPVIGYSSSLKKTGSNQTLGQQRKDHSKRENWTQNAVDHTEDFTVNGLSYLHLKDETSFAAGHSVPVRKPQEPFFPSILPDVLDARNKNHSIQAAVKSKNTSSSQIKKREIGMSRTHSIGPRSAPLLHLNSGKSNLTELPSPEKILHLKVCPLESSNIQRMQSRGFKGDIRKQGRVLSRKASCPVSSAADNVILAMEGIAVNTRL
ncbi:E3 ubiquitin-protein ligase ZSWIM2 isoform X1 [Hypanus sabinus]|uniref:E3 ubiquitin-protein ligase ZSWIM2 isoform X1 n=2 Tax=Hypanus sabinus TaxID=79690 RepID=UPI0028C3DFD2|nr:E3 ubiquitin-protein ligase ZSWIM2 isoform X1 [Hypanus sabinus]